MQRPSIREGIMGKSVISSEPRRMPPSLTWRWVPGLKKRAPVRKRPSGITTTPPPCAAAWSMASWMATVLRVTLSPTAPKSVIRNRGPRSSIFTDVVSKNHAGISVPSGKVEDRVAGFGVQEIKRTITAITGRTEPILFIIFNFRKNTYYSYFVIKAMCKTILILSALKYLC